MGGQLREGVKKTKNKVLNSHYFFFLQNLHFYQRFEGFLIFTASLLHIYCLGLPVYDIHKLEARFVVTLSSSTSCEISLCRWSSSRSPQAPPRRTVES